MNPAVNFPLTFSLLKAEDDQDIYSLKCAGNPFSDVNSEERELGL